MHPSNPSPDPSLFIHPTADRCDPNAAGAHAPMGAVAAADSVPAVEEVQDPERWDGLS